jgi:sugar/nucleoside kinase (ribokinase family)
MTILVVGDIVTDTVVQLHQRIVHGGDAQASIIDTMGGQGANVARWLCRAGVTQVRLVATCSAEDVHERVEAVRRIGIDPQLFSVDAPPSRIVVMVDPLGVERSFLTQRGASALLNEEHADAVDLSTVKWCHISGYVLATESGQQFYARLRARCDELAIPTSFDPSSISEVQRSGPHEMLRLISKVAVIIPNEAEAIALTGAADSTTAAQSLLAYADTVVIKRGSAGCLGLNQVEVMHVNAQDVQAVDPTGAGDAFAAGLISQLVLGSGLASALAAGSSLAAQAVSISGAF